MFNLIEYIGYRLYQILSCLFPLRCCYILADCIGYIVFRLKRNENRERAVIMQRIYKNNIGFYSARRLVCKNIQLFNRDLVDFFRSGGLNEKNIDGFVKISGKEYLEDAFKQNKGVILVSAHIGGWEMSGIALAIKGYSVYGIVWRPRNKLVAGLFEKIRLKKGVGTVEVGLLRHVIELLHENKAIGIMLDVDGGDKGVPVVLWGHNVRLPRGAAAISLQTGASLLILLCFRDYENGYRLYLKKPELTGTEEEVTIGLFEIIKKYIENDPVRWHWIRYLFQH